MTIGIYSFKGTVAELKREISFIAIFQDQLKPLFKVYSLKSEYRLKA